MPLVESIGTIDFSNATDEETFQEVVSRIKKQRLLLVLTVYNGIISEDAE